jgi:hypothetical protein
VYGYFSGTNAQTYAGISVPASTWLLVSTGYDNNPALGRVTGHTTYAEVTLSGLSSGKVAAAWNHLFITSPLVAGQCSLDFSGNNISVNVPLYVIGNMCLGGSTITETTQPIDLMVGGYTTSTAAGRQRLRPDHERRRCGRLLGSTNGSAHSVHERCLELPRQGKRHVHTKTLRGDTADIRRLLDLQPRACAPLCAGGNRTHRSQASDTTPTTAQALSPSPRSQLHVQCATGSGVSQLSGTTPVMTINGSVFIDGNRRSTSRSRHRYRSHRGLGVLFSEQHDGLRRATATSRTGGARQQPMLGSFRSRRTRLRSRSEQRPDLQGSLWTQPLDAHLRQERRFDPGR